MDTSATRRSACARARRGASVTYRVDDLMQELHKIGVPRQALNAICTATALTLLLSAINETKRPLADEDLKLAMTGVEVLLALVLEAHEVDVNLITRRLADAVKLRVQ